MSEDTLTGIINILFILVVITVVIIIKNRKSGGKIGFLKSFVNLHDLLNFIGTNKQNVSIYCGRGIGVSKPSEKTACLGWILGFLFGFIIILFVIAISWIVLPILLLIIGLYWINNKTKGYKLKGELIVLTTDAIHLFTMIMFNEKGSMRSFIYKKLLFDTSSSNFINPLKNTAQNVITEKLIKEEFFVKGIKIQIGTIGKASIVTWDDFQSLDTDSFVKELKKRNE